ncbi:MAG: hypothetical protein LBK41_01600 [Clostridiales bacterium]|jgi:hypothetical protein|nr:hypothetical protein [Clostridiales bacterium]
MRGDYNEPGANIFAAFGLRPCGGTRRGVRGYSASDGDIYRLRDAAQDTFFWRSRIELAHRVKERLAGSGSPAVDRFRQASRGEPFVSDGGRLYVAERVVNMPCADFSDPGQFLRVVMAVAETHAAMTWVSFGDELDYDTIRPSADIYASAVGAISRMAKIARSRPSMSDFDAVFMRGRARLLERLDEWIASAEYLNADEIERKASLSGYISHNALKDETVLISANAVAIVDFLSCARGHFAGDLAGIIARHFRQASHPLSPEAILLTYSSRNPLTADDIAMVALRMRYPERFLRTALTYYEKKRVFTPAALLSRIETIAAEQNSFDEYIEGFGKL